jgi:hypothetical protein
MRFPMPFPEKVEAREELCHLALSEGVNRRELVPPVQYSAAYFVQVAGSVPAGRCSGVVGPLPSTASQSVSDES